MKVYDVAQTDGPPLPDLRSDYQGDPAALPRIEAAAARLGLDLAPLPAVAPAEVLGSQRGRAVLVREGLAPLARCRVLAHEYAHALLHSGPQPLPPEAVREAEADATAWVVLQSLGIFFKSPAYIASHGGSGKTVLVSMRRIRAASRAILEALEGRAPSVRIPTLEWEPRHPSSHRINRDSIRPGKKEKRRPRRASPRAASAVCPLDRPGEPS